MDWHRWPLHWWISQAVLTAIRSTLALFLLIAVATVVFAVQLAGWHMAIAIPLLAGKALASLALMAVLADYALHIQRKSSIAGNGLLVFMWLLVLYLQSRTSWSGVRYATVEVIVISLLVGGLLTVGLRLIVSSPRWNGIATVAGTFLILAGLLSAGEAEPENLNHLGLVANRPGSTEVMDRITADQADNYPTSTFNYNSLGYRDQEPLPVPPERHTILVVGDSYIWGGGIPTNDLTLPGRLREELERRAPGRWHVTSAAYPGLGLYGYSRLIDGMAPLVKPDLVVIGYLGSPDFDAFDPQLLTETLSGFAPWRKLVVKLGIAQHFHDTSVRFIPFLSNTDMAGNHFNGILGQMRLNADALGYRIGFINYCRTPDTARDVLPVGETWGIPEELLDPESAAIMWYGDNGHPTPLMNLKLAEWLADRIIGANPELNPRQTWNVPTRRRAVR